MSKFVDASDVNDQAKGAVDFYAGLLDASVAEGGVDHSSFRGDCAALIPGQLPALARKLAGACDVLWKYSSGKEIESCFLLLCSLVRSATADERGAVALALSASVAQQSGADIQLRSRLLATLFNFFPAHRFVLLLEFVEQSKKNKDCSTISSQVHLLSEWCDAWGLTAAQRRQVFYACFELFVVCSDSQRALQLLKTGLKAVEEVDSDALDKARRAVVLALSLPDQYVLDDLAALPAVAALATAPELALVHQLLQIVVQGSVAEFEAFAATNSSLLLSNNLSAKELLSKMRLLALASAAADKQVLPYADAAKALGMPDDGAALETWIIRAISQGLISGKLDQLSRTVKISGAVSRTFGPKQWDSVAADIQVWLDAVKKVILLVNQSSGVQTK